MIEFEGFGLENTEQNIIDKQFSTQPRILKQFMTALGAKEGSSSTKRYDWQTEEQKDLFSDTLSGYKNLEYEGPGEYKEGTKADDLEGFKATDINSLRRLQDEGQLSVAGLEKLRNLGATSAQQVNPMVQGLMKSGNEAWQGYDAHLSETTRGAREKLQAADIASRRGGGGTGGTALTRAIGQNIGDYGRTVGQAAARTAEESAFKRQQLQQAGYGAAGQLASWAGGQNLQGLLGAQRGELGQLQLTAQDLAQRRSIHSQERQYMAQNELQRARYSGERADARNIWNQTNAANRNTWGLNRLRDQTAASTTRTFEDVVTKKAGSAGLGGAVLTAGGAVLGGMYGGPAGAAAGAKFGGAIASSSGDWGNDSYSGAIQAGTGMYASMAPQGEQNYGSGNAVPPSMRGMGNRPQTEYAWYEDDPNSGWMDTWGQSNAQTNLNISEQQLAANNWDTRLRNRTNYVNQQLAPTSRNYNQGSNYGNFDYRNFFSSGIGNNPDRSNYYANFYAPQGYGAS